MNERSRIERAETWMLQNRSYYSVQKPIFTYFMISYDELAVRLMVKPASIPKSCIVTQSFNSKDLKGADKYMRSGRKVMRPNFYLLKFLLSPSK